MERWVPDPLLQYSITPPLQRGLFYRIPFRHLVEETFFLKFLQKTQVDELFGLEILGLRQSRRQHVEHELDSLQSRIGLFWNRFNVAVIRILEHAGSFVAHVFGEDALSVFFIRIDKIDRFDETLERGLSPCRGC